MPETPSTSPTSRSPRGWLSWLLGPAADEVPRGYASAATGLRLLLGLLWLYNVSWKVPPSFGEGSGTGLFKFLKEAVDNPVLPPYSFVVEHLVLPNIGLFGWGVIVVEAALAVMLLTGSWVRLAAVLGIAESIAIGLSVALAPGEWPWSYALMIGAHALLLFSSAGRVFAVDGVRGLGVPPRRLTDPWGILAIALGLYSIVTSVGDPWAAEGTGLRFTSLQTSLGVYNVAGGLVLVVVGVLLVLATRTNPKLALAGSVVAVLGALSLYVQIGFSDPVLGGDGSSAAVLLSLAVIGSTVVMTARGVPR